MTRSYALGAACLALLMLLPAFGPAASASDCDRADAIRKHVAASDKMPEEVKKELLAEAASLCPEKKDPSAALDLAEKALKADKPSDALKHFQSALKADPKKTCPLMIQAARKLAKKDDKKLAIMYYEAALSHSDDRKALEEYHQLAKAVPPPALEAKGPSNLVPKDVIVRSLSGDRRGRRHDDDSPGYSRYQDDDSQGRRRGRYRYEDEDVPAVVFHNILFESGSARLTQSSMRQLDELGMALSSSALRRIGTFYIDGHTDAVGPDDANCRLGYERARSVIRYLAEKWDIHPRMLVPRSFGEGRPVADNDTPDGRQLNRRVEVKNGEILELKGYQWAGRCR